MNVRTGGKRAWSLVAVALVGVAVLACGAQEGGSVQSAAVAEGVPAPGPSLNDASPVTAFMVYGDSLHFASDSPGVVNVNRTTPSGLSELRVRSEVRLPNTTDTAYVRGRIIMKFETVRAPSAYGVPVGNAYLWVKDSGGGNYLGTLVWKNYVTGDTGRLRVVRQMHSTQRVISPAKPPQCLNLGASAVGLAAAAADTLGVCCLCGDGRMNCPMIAEISMARLDSLMTHAGLPPKP